MRRRKMLILSALVAIIAGIMCFAPSASANSAQKSWSGVSSTGALIVGEDCPLTVRSEKLAFDIPQFPEMFRGGDDTDVMQDYKAAVTATYEIENPADYDVNVSLAFPFGAVPYYFDSTQLLSSAYSVKADGKDVERKVRYTYVEGKWNLDFVTAEATAKLKDEKASFGWVNADTTVVEYTYSVSGAHIDDYYVYVRTSGNPDSRVFGYTDLYRETSAGGEYGIYTVNDRRITFYLVYSGQEPAVDLHAESNNVAIDFKAEKISETRMTLGEYADKTFAFADDSESAKTDWFNVVADYTANSEKASSVRLFGKEEDFINENVMCWYEYDLFVPAGETVVNSVTAPLFPAVDLSYDPGIYTYDYLLSPAKGWAEFGSLDIEINTPYYVLDAQENGFEKTEAGYKKSFASLPDGELSFRLSESLNPQKNTGNIALMLLFVMLGLVPALGIAGIVSLTVVGSIGAHRKNAVEKDPKKRTENTLRAAGIGFVSSLALSLSLIIPTLSLLAGLEETGAVITVIAVFFVLAAAVEAIAVRLLYVGKSKPFGKNDANGEDSENEEEKENKN